MKYVSVAEMVAIENEADSKGYCYSDMMEEAGRGLAIVVDQDFGKCGNQFALGLVGSGNNGGDTLVALCYLLEWGWQATAYLVRKRPENDPLLSRAREAGCNIIEMESDDDYLALQASLQTHNVLLDGVLGTGIQLPLRGRVGEVLSYVKQILKNSPSKIHVVAVDCPSGIDCDTGDAAEEVIPADLTVTMAAIKQGLLKFPAFSLVGNLKCIGIGLPAGLEIYESINRSVIDIEKVRSILPERPLDAHKSTFGVVMIIAGSLHYSGAVLLAGEAAFRSGAGWVTLAVPAPLHGALAGNFIEATWLPLPHKQGWISEQASKVLQENLDRVTTLVLGPGLGMKPWTHEFIHQLLRIGKENLPDMVIDADGLKILSEIPQWHEKIPPQSVLTPHPGEMAVLTGEPVKEIISNRVRVAELYAKIWGQVVVLKGAFTTIASPDGQTAISPVATPALARAGTGDVLAGLIGGLWAQGMDAFQAAIAGTWIHANAGLIAADTLGSTASVLAGDVLDAVVDVIATLNQ